MELEKYRNDQEVSQSFLVNIEAPDETEHHRDYNVRKSLKCSTVYIKDVFYIPALFILVHVH